MGHRNIVVLQPARTLPQAMRTLTATRTSHNRRRNTRMLGCTLKDLRPCHPCVRHAYHSLRLLRPLESRLRFRAKTRLCSLRRLPARCQAGTAAGQARVDPSSRGDHKMALECFARRRRVSVCAHRMNTTDESQHLLPSSPRRFRLISAATFPAPSAHGSITCSASSLLHTLCCQPRTSRLREKKSAGYCRAPASRLPKPKSTASAFSNASLTR